MQIVLLTTNTDPARQVRYLGPYQIAWHLRSAGYSTQVLDFLYFMTKEQRISLFKKFITSETKIVGYAPFAMIESDQQFVSGKNTLFEILLEIKENFPWVKIITGGQWVRDFLKVGYKAINFKLDAIFKDEGEQSVLDYCNHIFKNSPAPVFQLGAGGNKIYMPSAPFDIQSCTMKFAINDFVLPGESLPLELSRGCIFKCKFCQYPNIGKDKDDFNKSMDCVKESLISNYELFGTTRYHITDDTLNSHRERTKNFHEMVNKLFFKIEYIGYVRMDLLDIWPEQVDLLPESGLISCHFGIESFDEEACRMIGKGWGAKNNKRFLTYLGEKWKDDVIINCSMIAGLAKETEKEWEASNTWLSESKVHDWHFNKLYLSRNLGISEFEKEPEKYGYRFVNNLWETDYVDEKRAREWCDHNKKNSMSKRLPSVWNFSAVRNLGLEKDFILKSNYLEIKKIRQEQNLTGKMIDAYYTKAMEY